MIIYQYNMNILIDEHWDYFIDDNIKYYIIWL